MLTAALNHLLGQRADLRATLRRQAGRVWGLRIPPAAWTFRINDDGLLVAGAPEAEASLEFAASLLPRFWFNAEGAAREVRLDGDSALATDVGRVLQALDWDAEADLARIAGDALAHRIVTDARRLFGSPRACLGELSGTIAEYLQEEARVLATRPGVDRFMQDVDTLRDDVARLEARLNRLDTRRHPCGAAEVLVHEIGPFPPTHRQAPSQ